MSNHRIERPFLSSTALNVVPGLTWENGKFTYIHGQMYVPVCSYHSHVITQTSSRCASAEYFNEPVTRANEIMIQLSDKPFGRVIPLSLSRLVKGPAHEICRKIIQTTRIGPMSALKSTVRLRIAISRTGFSDLSTRTWERVWTVYIQRKKYSLLLSCKVRSLYYIELASRKQHKTADLWLWRRARFIAARLGHILGQEIKALML